MDDSLELREQLSKAWQAVVAGAVARGYPLQAVIETMASIAHEQFAEQFGAPAAASYLQLLAEKLREGERNDTVSLVRGSKPETAIEDDPAAFTPNWPVEDPLL